QLDPTAAELGHDLHASAAEAHRSILAYESSGAVQEDLDLSRGPRALQESSPVRSCPEGTGRITSTSVHDHDDDVRTGASASPKRRGHPNTCKRLQIDQLI